MSLRWVSAVFSPCLLCVYVCVCVSVGGVLLVVSEWRRGCSAGDVRLLWDVQQQQQQRIDVPED